MDNQAYLNQIANDLNLKNKKTNFFSSKFFIFVVAAVFAFIIIIIVGNILKSNISSAKDDTISLNIHSTNLISTISTYQVNLKSSELRGYSASLSSILSETSSVLSNYIEETYGIKQSSYDKSLIESEEILSESLNNELFSAKINGILDRAYAHSMAYEISIITARESEIYDSLKNDTTKASINNSYDSLSTLFEKFSNFSES